MTRNEKILVKCLRGIAEAYFNKDKRLNTRCGICYALYKWNWEVLEIPPVTHRELQELLGINLRKVQDYEVYITRPGGIWDARANLCLILAEVIEKGNFDD